MEHIFFSHVVIRDNYIFFQATFKFSGTGKGECHWQNQTKQVFSIEWQW